MNYDDIIYIALLVLCILFGRVYRGFQDTAHAKLLGTVLGLFIVSVVSGWHALHPIISSLICGLIILLVDKRYVSSNVFCIQICLR